MLTVHQVDEKMVLSKKIKVRLGDNLVLKRLNSWTIKDLTMRNQPRIKHELLFK